MVICVFIFQSFGSPVSGFFFCHQAHLELFHTILMSLPPVAQKFWVTASEVPQGQGGFLSVINVWDVWRAFLSWCLWQCSDAGLGKWRLCSRRGELGAQRNVSQYLIPPRTKKSKCIPAYGLLVLNKHTVSGLLWDDLKLLWGGQKCQCL